MIMKHPIWVFLLVICLGSCENAYDAEKVARHYCDCMKSNKATEDFNKADKICGDKLVAENRYIRLWTVDMNDRELDKKISNEMRDSVKIFFDRFRAYTDAHCCKEVLACPDSTELR